MLPFPALDVTPARTTLPAGDDDESFAARLQAALDALLDPEDDEPDEDEEILEELDDTPPDHPFDPRDPFSDFEEAGVDPRDPRRRVRLPCPREIRARCEAIRATWHPWDFKRRIVDDATQRIARGGSVVIPTIRDTDRGRHHLSDA
jgi:hypothetical protein